LYKLKKEKLEFVSEPGLYLLKDGKVFDSNEWTVLNGNEACYYMGSGSCYVDKLKNYRKHKYIINKANGKIVTYSSEKGAWRTVDEDGYYFFFEYDNEIYSIDLEDRRVDYVKRIIDGSLVNIPINNNGMYLIDDFNEKLRVELLNGKLEDAENVIENVEVSGRRKCKAIEINEKIDEGEYCYNEKLGICAPKGTIIDNLMSESNCIFGNNKNNYYYLINGSLYIINDYSYQRVTRDGLYVIDNDNMAYSSRNEGESSAYLCENGNCILKKQLNSMYYLNIAALELGKNVILYYNSKNNSWKKTDVNGIYFFNKSGYGASEGDVVSSYYEVSEKGNVVEERELVLKSKVKSTEENVFVSYIKIKNEFVSCTIDINEKVKPKTKLMVGDYCITDKNKLVYIKNIEKINDGNGEVEIYGGEQVDKEGKGIEIQVNESKWIVSDGKTVETYERTAQKLVSCTIDVNGNVKPESELNIGDICITNENKLVFISNVKKSEKSDEEVQEMIYTGVESSNNSKKYVYNEETGKFVLLDEKSVEELVIGDGLLVIDNETMLPLESEKSVSAVAYKCIKEKCTKIEISKLDEGRNYRNASPSTKYPLLEYIGNGNWKVENELGYYFFDEKENPVDVDKRSDIIYEVYSDNGVLKQSDILEENILGYFINKAAKKKNIIPNNKQFWSPAKELNKCTTKLDNNGGIICKTGNDNPEGFVKGEYCYDNKKLYFLTGIANNASEVANCVYGTNDNPKYIYYGTGSSSGILNGESLSKKLIQIDQEAIREAKKGYYIIDAEKGELIKEIKSKEENVTEEINPVVYKCDENECGIVNIRDGEMIQTADGRLYEMDEDEGIVSISKEGMYFLGDDGGVCGSDNKIVGSIVKISEGGKKQERISLNELNDGAYINEGNNGYVGVYENGKWKIENVECEFDEDEGTCSNYNLDLDVGSYCSVNGKMYMIVSVDESNEKKCVPGKDDNPLYFKSKENELLVVKEKSVNVVKEEGYYAINDATLEALVSEVPVKSQFILCEYGGDCQDVKPEIGRYLNRSPAEKNIVKFDSGNVNETVTVDSKCVVEQNVCNAVSANVTLAVGDVCIDESSIYIVRSDSGDCLKAEKAVVTYQVINEKMYMLTDDAVVQKLDGYYFINGNNRAITKKSDYSKSDTVGYMCSNKGDCFLLEPKGLSYFPDYTTKSSKKYNVVKFDPELKSARRRRQEENEGNSGYESITEAGIYKLDDGTYTECEVDDKDEVSCHDIEGEGSYKTKDDEVIVCVENDEGEVECSQAVEGGYYNFDGELMSCEANVDGSKLECEEMDKEGYFKAKPDDQLWKCEEKFDEDEDEQAQVPEDEVNINKILEKLDGNGENSGDSNDEDEETTTSETTTTSTTTIEETTTTTTTEEPSATPVEVKCKPVKCIVGEKIYKKDKNGEDVKDAPMYECKAVPEKGNEFVSTCESGNYIKDRNGFYICEDDKRDLDEEKIEKPNNEHTSKTEAPSDSTVTTSTTATVTTSSSSSKTSSNSETTSSSSSTPNATTSSQATTTPPPETTKTSKTATTTAAPKTATTTTAGASSMFRLPSITFYLVIFIVTYYIFL